MDSCGESAAYKQTDSRYLCRNSFFYGRASFLPFR
jgi:hypothetical protein